MRVAAGRAARPGQPVHRHATRAATSARRSTSTACSSGASPPGCWPGCSSWPAWTGRGTRRPVEPLPEAMVTLAAADVGATPWRRGAAVIRRPARGAADQLRRHRLPAGAAGQHAVARRVPGRWGAGDVAAAAAAAAAGAASATASCAAPSCWSSGSSCCASLGQGARRARSAPGCAGTSGSSRPGSSTRSSARSPRWSRSDPGAGSWPAPCAAGRPRRWPGRSAVADRCGRSTRRCPPQTTQLFAGFRALLDREGFPRVFEGVAGRADPPGRPARPRGHAPRGAWPRPAPRSSRSPASPRSCNRGQEGSGWVVAAGPGGHQRPRRGRHEPRRPCGSTGAGRSYDARVVVFDPQRDLAVLDVPGLRAPPLRAGRRRSAAATAAVVAGLPAGRALPAGRGPGARRSLSARRRRHLRPAGHRPRGLLALRPGRAGQLRRPAAVDRTAGSSASSSPSRWTTPAPATR